ncbi:MAG TPA: universal stress protein [Thermoplasmata archaeon]|jgi:nucleotide-binding universal stress UspA family protein|nr:universal stress protein [Thermoplasmata archaeon]
MGLPPFARITVAIDGSKMGELAFDLALDLARRYQSDLTVIAVAPLQPVFVSSSEPWVPTEVPEAETNFYRGIVDKAVRKATTAGVSASGESLEGVVVDEIIAHVEKHPTDLLVLGSRGLSTAKRLLLGSVSDAVSHHVTCPVLIARAPASGPPG